MPYSVSSGGANAVQAVSTQSDGKTFQQLREECLRGKKLFEDPDFPACDTSLFYSERVPINFEWKRPGVCIFQNLPGRLDHFKTGSARLMNDQVKTFLSRV